MALPYDLQRLTARRAAAVDFGARAPGASAGAGFLEKPRVRSEAPIDLFAETFVGLSFSANETFLGGRLAVSRPRRVSCHFPHRTVRVQPDVR